MQPKQTRIVIFSSLIVFAIFSVYFFLYNPNQDDTLKLNNNAIYSHETPHVSDYKKKEISNAEIVERSTLLYSKRREFVKAGNELMVKSVNDRCSSLTQREQVFSNNSIH